MAKPLVTVADQAFFAASIEKELTARTAWAAKFKHLLERPVRKSHHRPFDLPSIPCEPKDQTGKYAVKRRDYDKEHIAMIDILLADRKEKPLLPVMYPLAEKEEGILAGDKKELLPEIRKMRDNKTEYHDRFRDYGVGEKINRTFVTKSDAAEAKEGAEDAAAAPALADPVRLEGTPRTQYLKDRNVKAPDEKFFFPITQQQRYGWNLSKEMPPEKIHGSKFARIQVLESECFRDNCIQYPPDHLDTHGGTMADLRNNAGDSTTTRGVAQPGKW